MFDPEKILNLLLKLGFASLALVVSADLILQILSRMSFTALTMALMGLALVSPIAYLLLKSGGDRAERRPHRGAERTPLLPPHEEV